MENVSKLAVEDKVIVGLTGLAGSGKDTFYSLLSKKLPFVRYAIADELKIILRQRLLEKYGFDILNCNRDEKNVMRDDIVSFAKQRREETQGKYWTTILQDKILSSSDKYICITDIRFNYYPEDEVFWLKTKLKGKLIDVSSYSPLNGKFMSPPNQEEAVNYPLVRSAADYFVMWPKVQNIKSLDIFIEQAILDLNIK